MFLSLYKVYVRPVEVCPRRYGQLSNKSSCMDRKSRRRNRHKYLIEKDMTMAQVVYIIRNRIKLDSKHALFIFVGKGVLPANTATVGQTYKEYADEDCMLRVRYRLEKTFG